MNSMDVYEVVTKLIGPVNPVGCSQSDAVRLENVKVLTALVDSLLTDIDGIAMSYKDSHEHSVKLIGQHCSGFLDQIGIQE